VDSVLTTLKSEVERKRITFTAQVPTDLPPVIADREKLSQVLENLAINAVKFTPEGGRINVAAVRTEVGGRATTEVRVSDTGIGIPETQIGKIFNRFHQVDGSTTRRFGGVGLGLAIVKSILEAHGSAISVESEVGRGTTFRFSLPLLEKGAEAPGREDRATPRDGEGLVLIVDDDLDLLRMTKSRLEQEGFAVLTATTGEQGARIAAMRRPDAILLDLLLPDTSGLEVLRSLKAEAATRDIPVVVVSIANDGVRSLSLGMVEWLCTPVEAATVVASARRLLAGSSVDAPTVVLVEAEAGGDQPLREALKDDGFRVITAHGSDQAFEVLARTEPDLVVLDMMMPELSGFKVLEALRRGTRDASIPVVVLAARADDADGERGAALRARRYMSRPLDVSALIVEIQRQVNGRASASRSRQATL
jgi:DNA-binding response OmpR family regulator